MSCWIGFKDENEKDGWGFKEENSIKNFKVEITHKQVLIAKVWLFDWYNILRQRQNREYILQILYCQEAQYNSCYLSALD